MAECHPGAVPWVQHWLYDCLYTSRDMVGFSCGMASIACWIVAQIPQLVQNYRTKKAEALSPWFLAQWLMGDTTNLIGCLLSGEQLPTTTYTAMWFIFADICLMVQYIYYGSLQRRHQRQQSKYWSERQRHSVSHSEDVPPNLRPDAAALQDGRKLTKAVKVPSGRHQPVLNRTSWASNSAPTRMLSCCALIFVVRQSFMFGGLDMETAGLPAGSLRRLLFDAPAAVVLSKSHNPAWARVAGTWVGYLSSVLYLSSRMSQIHKNWSRRSAEGLAYAMFICSISANCLYGLGILIRTYHTSQLWSSLPWLIGSLGTVSLDVIILSQVCLYGTHEAKQQDPEADNLLTEVDQQPRESA
ncbi:hypothetical protein WJX84_010978 [Apatococcus fuscideae]|uniref:Uncharacterized protein n=1 Tax=Apatococcus fuscideae TaxID=2026836 RepID=A0AAW1TK03_9CHLO